MLFKNVLTTLLQKWMQLVAIGVIVVLSSMTYTMMFYGLSGIAEPTTTYLDASEQEDFAVEMLSVLTPDELQSPLVQGVVSRGHYSLAEIARDEPATFQALMDARMKAFEEVYPGVSLEVRRFKVLRFDHDGREHTGLAVRDAERVNLSYLESGTMPTRDDEIALNRMYAQKNGIEIGDSFELLGTTYRVTGFVLFPDYTLTTFDNSLNVDTGLQPLILLTTASYDAVDAAEGFRLAGVTPGDAAIDTAYDLDQLPFVTQIVSTEANMRSGAIYDELTQGRVMGLGLSIFIASIAVVIVSIMMSNLLHAERGQIGILKALGYRRREIAWPYFASVVSFALVMLAVGYVVGTWLADPLKRLYLDFYLLPQTEIAQSVGVFATAIFVPLLFFALFSGAVIYRMLGEGPIALLKPHESSYLNAMTRVVSKLLGRAKTSTKFTYLHAIANTRSFLVFLVGIMFSTLLITFAFMMGGIVDRMMVGTLDQQGYSHQAFLDPGRPAPEVRPGDEKFLTYPYAYVGTRVVSLQGLSPDGVLFSLFDADGDTITERIGQDVVITESASLKLGLEEGDEFTVRVNGDDHTFRVAGVADEYSSDTVYLDIATLSRILSQDTSETLYSGVYASEEPPEEYGAVISREGLRDQSRAMSTYVTVMVWVMIGAAALIAASILFVLTAFSVERNYYSISLLKVLGYSRREVNSMILTSYFVYSLVCYALSVPIALVTMDALQRLFLQEYGLVMPFEFVPVDVLKGLVILVVIFLGGTWVSRRKIERIPLQEVLKSYGE